MSEANMDCHFCKRNINHIDYKETALLSRFLSGLAKIKPRKKTAVCAKHQLVLSRAIKRARYMALLPYVPE